ncbi:MAG: hypothetical protein FIA95_01325 [Gemmatimonadetes bacterium]|nr:hypothetical protein [Gemmatimonadota bacterium]
MASSGGGECQQTGKEDRIDPAHGCAPALRTETGRRLSRPEYGRGSTPREETNRTTPQIRFVEMVVEQLTSRGVMDASALYEPPFTHLAAEGPEVLFQGRGEVIAGVSSALKATDAGLIAVQSGR